MPSRDIKDCVQELQIKWPLILDRFLLVYPDWGMVLTCTHRPKEEQFDLFKKGRREVNGEWVVDSPGQVVTYMDGFTKVGKHNLYPSEALDLALKQPDGKLNWDTKSEQWQSIPKIAGEFGLVSGGSWKTFKDYPHIETRRV